MCVSFLRNNTTPESGDRFNWCEVEPWHIPNLCKKGMTTDYISVQLITQYCVACHLTQVLYKLDLSTDECCLYDLLEQNPTRPTVIWKYSMRGVMDMGQREAECCNHPEVHGCHISTRSSMLSCLYHSDLPNITMFNLSMNFTHLVFCWRSYSEPICKTN